MKRAVSILLSVVMILCSLTCLLISPASAATNLWMGLSIDDWYTRQTDANVASYADLTEQKMTDKYPTDFSESDGVYTLNSAYNKFYYLKMPALSQNKEYTVSFRYDATLFDQGTTPLLSRVYLIPQWAMDYVHNGTGVFNHANTTMTGQVRDGLTGWGVKEAIKNRTLTSDNASDVITYSFNTGTQTQYYLYIQFGYIEHVSFSDFAVFDPSTDEEGNLWNSVSWRTDNDSVSFETATDATEGEVVEVTNPWSSNLYSRLPVLQAGKKYEISFKYKSKLPAQRPTGEMSNIKLATVAAFEDISNWNVWTGGKRLADGKSGVIDMAGTIPFTSDVWVNYSYEFETGNDTDFYLYLRTGYTYEFYMTDFSIREVKDAFVAQPVFYNTDGRVTSSNHYAKLTTQVGGQEVAEIEAGDEVTATVTYDTASNAYQFYGWVNKAGDVVSEETTFTFTASAAECYEPWIIEKNLVDSASFENLADGKSLQVAVDETNKKADAPSGELWGFVANGGYYKATTAGTVVGSNGTTYNQVASGSFGAKGADSVVVSSEEARSGNNSLFININGWSTIRVLKVKKNTNYSLHFYYRTGKEQTSQGIGSVSIVTTYNWGQGSSAQPSATHKQLANDRYNNPRYVTVAASNVTSSLYADGWTQVSCDFNSGKFETLYLLLKGNKGDSTAYVDDITLVDKDDTDFSLFPAIEPEVNDDNLGSVSPASATKEAGKVVEFTASYLKGNSFKGWYDSKGKLLTTDLTLSYTIPDDYASPKAVFEAGTPAVENAGMEDSSGYLAHYQKNDEDVFEKVIVDPLWDVEFPGATWPANIQAKSDLTHSGNMAVRLQTQNNYAGRHFTGLEKNTDYAISFWTYIDRNTTYTLKAYVAPKGTLPYTETINSKGETVHPQLTAAEALGTSVNTATALSKWQEVVVNFNSGDNTEVTLWMLVRDDNEGTYLVWVDDFAIYDPAVFNAYAGLGGSVTASASGSVVRGSTITVTATPDTGNTFKHWVDENGKVYSTDATTTVIAEGEKSLRAVFDGYNKNARELFAYNGQDGTFENGSITGWYGDDPTYGKENCGHCSWSVVDPATTKGAEVYEGDKALRVASYYRNTLLPLTGLSPDTDYKFSFYVKYPYTGSDEDKRHIYNFGIVGADDIDWESAETQYVGNEELIATDSGWWKAELYFNTGDATAVNFVFRYAGEPLAAPHTPYTYFDNVELWEYYSNDTLTNGDAENGTAPWLGDMSQATDGGNKVFTMPAMGTMYQTFAVEPYSNYTVSFKAKGEVLATASDIYATYPDFNSFVTSQSYTLASSEDWKKFEFQVYSGIRTNLRLIFGAILPDSMIDDIMVTKEINPVGAVIEHIDFETERFALGQSDSAAYEIYTATKDDDPNVHSGASSLHFKHSGAAENVATVLEEAFVSYGVEKNRNYRVTMYYKADKGNTIQLAPNYPAYSYKGWTGDFSGELGREHTGTGAWEKIVFTFTAGETGFLKLAISNIVGKTTGDFYIDDITIAVGPDLVTDPDTDKAYCSQFYSIIKNGGFEQEISDKNWKDLPAGAKVIEDKAQADTADHFLRLTAGTKYILPVSLEAGEVYYFGASYKAGLGGKGTISLATMVDPGTIYFLDSNDKDASIITVDNTDGWKRTAFGFRANASGTTYLILECTAGTIDVDSISLCAEKFALTEDPNRYYERVPFDYNNIDPSIIVYNGGVTDAGATPDTGDRAVLPIVAGILGMLSVAAVLMMRKRKEKANV